MFRREVTKDEMRKIYPAIFAESEKETLSDKYLYIPTYKLIEGLERNGFKTVGAKQVRSKSAGREHGKHVVYMAHDSLNSVMKVGDSKPMIALTNSHNGSSAFAIDTAFFRLVCSNGLMTPSSELNSARIVHKVGMQDDVIEACFKVVENFPKQAQLVEMMTQVKLNIDEKMLLAESAQNLAFEPETIELNKELGREIAPKLLTARRYDDRGDDLWRTFNVIQENIIKGGVRIVRENDQGRRSLARTRAVNSIDRDSKLNKELMTLAQKMLELKTGVVA